MAVSIDHERQRAIVRLLKQVYIWATRLGLLIPLREKMISSSQHRSLLQQSKLLSPIMQHGDADSNAPDYEAISQDLKGILVAAFQQDIEESYIGRFLFYLIKGGEKISKHSDVYLSPLPKLFYPTTCLSVWCDNPVIEVKDRKAFINNLQNYKGGKFLCNSKKCRKGWDEWRISIAAAIDIVYDFPGALTNNIDTEIAILLEGYQALSDYIFRKRHYQPRAMLFEPLSKALTVQDIAHLCLMPNQFSEMSGNAGSFGQTKDIQNTDVAIRLPAEVFDEEKITLNLYAREESDLPFRTYKKISVLQNNPQDSISEIYHPLDEIGLSDNHHYVLLKDLARLLASDAEEMIMSPNLDTVTKTAKQMFN